MIYDQCPCYLHLHFPGRSCLHLSIKRPPRTIANLSHHHLLPPSHTLLHFFIAPFFPTGNSSDILSRGMISQKYWSLVAMLQQRNSQTGQRDGSEPGQQKQTAETGKLNQVNAATSLESLIFCAHNEAILGRNAPLELVVRQQFAGPGSTQGGKILRLIP